MGVPFHDHGEPQEAEQSPSPDNDDGSRPPVDDVEGSTEESDDEEEDELQQPEWLSTDESEWEDPSEGYVLSLAFRAAEHGAEAELAQLLPMLSVPIDTQGPDGDTLLHLSALYGHLGCVRLLIEHGHRANVADDDGALPLHDAAAGGYIEVARLLLDEAPDTLNVQDGDGDAPLHNAARGGSEEVVALLIERGADLELENGDFKTPAGLAGGGSIISELIEGAIAAAAAAREIETPPTSRDASSQEAE